MDPKRIPVIVGTGESIDRQSTKEPRELLREAAAAAGDAAPALLRATDSIDVVSIVSCRYAQIGHLLAESLGIRVQRAHESVAGGEKPIRLLGEAAERIAAGESHVALICGADAMRTRAKAVQSGQTLDWGPTDPAAKAISALDFVTPLAARYGLVQPTAVYPLYENATRHAWGQSARDADQESAELWARYAEAAAGNPTAWLPRPFRPADILDDSADNRIIAYPYRKLMVANPMVNQGAAILVTSLAAARAAGVPDSQLVYIMSGARANEPADFLARDRYDRSTAQDAVLRSTVDTTVGDVARIDAYEIYSCFPTVPKMARRTLGLGTHFQPSVTGGLTFFGGPANNYMTHAIAAAVRELRAGSAQTALLYGQGEYVTKHAAIVLSAGAPAKPPVMQDVQAQADASAEPVPVLLEQYEGEARIETYTVEYDRAGQPTSATIIARTPEHSRVVARGPSGDRSLMDLLVSGVKDPIGQRGVIQPCADGLLVFDLASAHQP